MLPEKPPGGPELAREIPDAPLTTILPVQEDGLKAPPAADIEKQAPTEVRPNEGEVQVEDNRDPYLVDPHLCSSIHTYLTDLGP